jgi:hypothetical protein
MTNAAKYIRGVCWPSLPAAYEVSCRIRAGSPRSFWLHSPRTVASRLFGSPVPRRRGLGGKAATNGGDLSVRGADAMSTEMCGSVCHPPTPSCTAVEP